MIENTAWAVKRRHVFVIHEEEDNNAGIQSVLVYTLLGEHIIMKLDLISLQKKGDERGRLVVIENNKEVPFNIQRIYYICDNTLGVRRGFHAHKKLQQMAICVQGTCSFLMDNGKESQEITLDNNYTGLLIAPLIWHEMFNFSPDCVLLVMADDFYDESDYIRNYNDFINYISFNK